MARRHGRRPHTPGPGSRCPVNNKTSYTTWEAGMKVARGLVNAERPYRCDACGYFHVTSMTEGEYGQAMASMGVQDSAVRGMLDLPPAEYLAVVDRRRREEQALEARIAERRESASGQGHAGEASEWSSGISRLAPSPATVARRLATRGY